MFQEVAKYDENHLLLIRLRYHTIIMTGGRDSAYEHHQYARAFAFIDWRGNDNRFGYFD
jgi:hypothetical protein